jgi:hypothetical protein
MSLEISEAIKSIRIERQRPGISLAVVRTKSGEEWETMLADGLGIGLGEDYVRMCFEEGNKQGFKKRRVRR